MQETEDLTLETKVITAGVSAAIADPSKARYLIAEVGYSSRVWGRGGQGWPGNDQHCFSSVA